MARVTKAHIQARRDQILNAAWACFSRKGYHQTTMQEIAGAAGISAGAIYRYFAGKEAVLKGINERSQEMSRALVEDARVMAGDPLDVLQILGKTMMSLFSDPEYETVTRVNIEIWPEILRSEELREGLRREITFWLGAITELYREAQRKGELSEHVDPGGLAMVSICAWEGMRHYNLLTPEFRPEAIIEMTRALQPKEVRDRSDVDREVRPRRLYPPLGGGAGTPDGEPQ